MRLHRLRITAFGPFAVPTEIDFDVLGSDGLFLLHGPTGSGKTTILDAVAFALYGRVAGVRQECKRLHSDHAAADAVPQVELDATIAGRRLLLVRSPEFERPKRRGAGVIKENPKATLTWVDGSGPALSGMAEVGQKVSELVGMSADQFFQVVLLPQGEFARFLRAENDERAALLERLFSTARFGAAEEWLARRRRELGTELSEQSHAVDRIAAQAAAVAGTPDCDGDDPVAWSQQLLAAGQAQAASAAELLSVRQQQADAAAQRLATERERAGLRSRAAQARMDLQQYEAAGPTLAGLRRELTQAQRAEPVAAALEHAGEARTAAITALTGQRTAAQALAAIPGGERVAADGSDLEPLMREWAAGLGALDDIAADAAQLDQLSDDIAAAHAEIARITATLESITADSAAAAGQAEHVRAELTSAQAAAAVLPAAGIAAAQAEAALVAGQQLVKCHSQLDAAREVVRERRDRHAHTRTMLLDTREQRLAGMAAELAGQLQPGQPCVVCGSQTHPAPATASEQPVSAAQEEAAAEAESAAAESLSQAEATCAALVAQAQRLAGEGGDTDLATLIAAARSTTSERDQLATLANRVPDLLERYSKLGAAQAENEIKRQDLVGQLGTQRERAASQSRRRDELRARLAEVVGEDAGVPQRRARLEALLTSGTTLRNARAAATAAAGAAESHASHAAALAEAAGFASRDDATVARRTAERQQTIANELASAAAAQSAAETVLADTAVQAAEASVPVALAGLEASAAETAEQLRLAIAAHASAAAAATQLAGLCAQLWAAADQLAPLRERHRELASLAEVVAGRGANVRGISLHSYVLAERLEEVLLAATLRLRQMSSGRYEFVHSDQRGPRGKRGGLGIEIRDGYTGTVRPAKTLSGGETFIAALALALGLADSVAAQTGGLLMDTMFIDEGFGSLDADALDSVMGVLDELRAGGRVVGIVSHVDDLRQRIPSRLRVIREQEGSRLELAG